MNTASAATLRSGGGSGGPNGCCGVCSHMCGSGMQSGHIRHKQKQELLPLCAGKRLGSMGRSNSPFQASRFIVASFRSISQTRTS